VRSNVPIEESAPAVKEPASQEKKNYDDGEWVAK
jgi:hypothetical protein